MVRRDVQLAQHDERHSRSRRFGRMAMAVVASVWVVGCAIGVCYAFSAVRVKCAGCPECLRYAP